MNYRHDARKHLERAKEELDSGHDERLKYAMLELRMAMESITYDRAQTYKDEFPPDEYKTWQPKKVIAVLLEIDPNVDKDSSLAFGLEGPSGEPPTEMIGMGTNKVLNIATLKKHYDALGSYLHVPTVKQVREGRQVDFAKMRDRCEKIAAFIEEVLASPVFNITLGNFTTIECKECGKPIRKRILIGNDKVKAECFESNCPASYTIIDKDNSQVEWQPHHQEVKCANTECNCKITVWRKQIKQGIGWECPECGGQNTFAIGITYKAKDQ